MKKQPFEAAVAVMRVEILAAERAAQSRPRTYVHTLDELLHGAEVPDVPAEAKRWANQVLTEPRAWQMHPVMATSFAELSLEADAGMIEIVMNGCHMVAGEKPKGTLKLQHHRWATQAAAYLMMLGDRRGAKNLVCQVRELLETGEHTSLGFLQTTVTLYEALAVVTGDDRDVTKARPRLPARLKAAHELAMVSEAVLLHEAATAAPSEEDPAGFLRPAEDDGDIDVDVLDLERTYRAPLRPARKVYAEPARPTPADGPTLRPLVSGSLDHLAKGPMVAYRTSAKAPLPSVAVPDLAEIRERLVESRPWAAEQIRRILAPVTGRDRMTLPATALIGPQGSGKTEFAVDLCEAVGLPTTLMPCGGNGDGASFGGTSRMYSTVRVSVPAQLMLSAGNATVALVMDELDKIATSDTNGSLAAALLAMTEPSRRHAYRDPGLEADTDLSGLSVIVTANRREPLAGPLLDRLVCVSWPSPRRQDLPVVTRGIMRAIRRETGSDASWAPDLDRSEMRALEGWRGGSMRPLRRAIERLVALRSDPKLAN